MAFEYGGRLNKGDYFSTKVDVENQSALTKGTIDGEPVEFSGSAGLLYVNFTYDSETSSYVSDQSYADIEDAIESGMYVVGKTYDEGYYGNDTHYYYITHKYETSSADQNYYEFIMIPNISKSSTTASFNGFIYTVKADGDVIRSQYAFNVSLAS